MIDRAIQIDKFDYYIYVPEVGIVYLSGSAFKFEDVASEDLNEKFIKLKEDARLLLGATFKGEVKKEEDST